MNTIRTVEASRHVGQTVRLTGWLHNVRRLGGISFVVLRDGWGTLQAVTESEADLVPIAALNLESVIALTGTVVATSQAPGGVELHQPHIEVMTPVTEPTPVPLQQKQLKAGLPMLLDHAVVTNRHPERRAVFRLAAGAMASFRATLNANHFTEIQSPKLVASATESGANVFKLEYFGGSAYLAQSPQFYKQIMVGAFERVYEIGHSYRAEPSATTRHLTELTMLDIEMGFVESHQEVMDMVANMTKHALTDVYEKHADDLKSLNAPELKLTEDVPKFTIAEIHDMYTKATGTDTTDEKDLIPDEERWIADYARKELGSDLVYATDFPKEAGKFYHKFKDDGTVAWADLLFRGLEIATVPLRENNYEKMIEQMTEKGLDVAHDGFRHYLQAFKFGLPQHGGCGFGIDRLVQKTIGLSNVKEATLFPRDMNRLDP